MKAADVCDGGMLAGTAVSPEQLAGQLLAAELEAEAVTLVLHAQQQQLQQEEGDDWVSKPMLTFAAALLPNFCHVLCTSQLVPAMPVAAVQRSPAVCWDAHVFLALMLLSNQQMAHWMAYICSYICSYLRRCAWLSQLYLLYLCSAGCNR